MLRSCLGLLAPLVGLVGPVGLVGLVGLVGPSPAAATALEWRLSAAVPGLTEAGAVAWDEARGRLAVGDATGVWLGALAGPGVRVLRRGPVHDLLFLASGSLLVASERGLHEIDADGTAREHALAPGAAAKLVRRLAAAGELRVAATDDGAFASWASGPWRRLDAGLPGGPAQAIALRETPAGIETWLVANGELHRSLVPAEEGAGPAAQVLRSEAMPGVRRATDVVTGVGGAAVLVLSQDRLLGFDGVRWSAVRPGLPPGAEVRRLAAAAGRVWIATDTGLLEAPVWTGPWRRTGPPAGAAAVADVAGDALLVLAAADRGLLAGAAAPPRAPEGETTLRPPATPSASSEPGTSGSGAEEPDVAAVQRAALQYLDLGPGRMRELRRGVDRRAWLPLVDLSASQGRTRGRSSNHDEAFVSGSYHDLQDLAYDRDSDREVELSLVWNLGSLLYDPESLDVSKEAREVVELRDEVLDEVVQLYFERRRTLLELSLAPPDGPERERLRLRADELAAGLDAWTGGWFGRRAPPLAAPSPELSPQVPPEYQP